MPIARLIDRFPHMSPTSVRDRLRQAEFLEGLTDSALHPLLLRGSSEDLRRVAWILMFDNMHARFPKRPKAVARPEIPKVYSAVRAQFAGIDAFRTSH